MKNYQLIEVTPEIAEYLDRLLAECQNTGEGPCRKCGSRAYWYPLCRPCRGSCNHQPLKGWRLQANGSKAPRAICTLCGLRLPDPPRGSAIFDYCIAGDINPIPCERCGQQTGVELHHWAPRNTFGFHEADLWPQSWLCRSCHHEWHTRMDGYQWRKANPEWQAA